MSNILQDLYDCELSFIDCGHRAFIVDVGPALAQKLLAANFHQNRKLSKAYVDRMSADMKNGEWGLSNDAIVVSSDLQIGNAQHRLNAVVQSNTSQKFIVLFGSPKEAFQKFDTGKKRTMEQRITISGTEVSQKECCIIRHSMNDYANPGVGTVQYGYQRHDNLVAATYRKHKEFLTLVHAKQPGGSSFIYAAALKIYAEMLNYSTISLYQHNHHPLTRAQLFIDLCLNGYSSVDIACGSTEIAALKLRNTIARKKEELKGQYWSQKSDFRVTVTAAYKFMLGEKVVNLVPFKSDPFHNFLKTPSTNSARFLEDNSMSSMQTTF